MTNFPLKQLEESSRGDVFFQCIVNNYHYIEPQDTDHFQKTSQNNPVEEHLGYFNTHTWKEIQEAQSRGSY